MNNMMMLVELKEYAFLPTRMSWVYPGDDLLFWNSGNQTHQIVGEGVESPELLPGMVWQFQLTEEKEYKFTCSKHENESFICEVVPMPKVDEGF